MSSDRDVLDLMATLRASLGLPPKEDLPDREPGDEHQDHPGDPEPSDPGKFLPRRENGSQRGTGDAVADHPPSRTGFAQHGPPVSSPVTSSHVSEVDIISRLT